jgi:hypothetical protein
MGSVDRSMEEALYGRQVLKLEHLAPEFEHLWSNSS